MKQVLLRLKLGRSGEWSVTFLVVPRTDVLADVDTKDVVYHLVSEFQRNLTTLFNCQVSDAAAGVQLARGDNGVRGTSVNASSATSAAVRYRDSWREIERSKYDSQKKEGAQLGMDQAGILANPTEARILGVDTLHDGPCIDVAACLAREVVLGCKLLDGGLNLFKARLQRLMIVLISPGVAGDPCAPRVVNLRGVGPLRVVIQAADDYRAHPRRGIPG